MRQSVGCIKRSATYARAPIPAPRRLDVRAVHTPHQLHPIPTKGSGAACLVKHLIGCGTPRGDRLSTSHCVAPLAGHVAAAARPPDRNVPQGRHHFARRERQQMSPLCGWSPCPPAAHPLRQDSCRLLVARCRESDERSGTSAAAIRRPMRLAIRPKGRSKAQKNGASAVAAPTKSAALDTADGYQPSGAPRPLSHPARDPGPSIGRGKHHDTGAPRAGDNFHDFIG